MISKIEDLHRQKAAYIYIRQSTVAQVRHHQESTERQYGLRDKAVELGWASSMIRILDQDLGKSGAQLTGREDPLPPRAPGRRRRPPGVAVRGGARALGVPGRGLLPPAGGQAYEGGEQEKARDRGHVSTGRAHCKGRPQASARPTT